MEARNLEYRVTKLEESVERWETLQKGVNTTLLQILKEHDQLKSDVSGLKHDVAGLKSDVAGLKSDVAGLKTDGRGQRFEKIDQRYSKWRIH